MKKLIFLFSKDTHNSHRNKSRSTAQTETTVVEWSRTCFIDWWKSVCGINAKTHSYCCSDVPVAKWSPAQSRKTHKHITSEVCSTAITLFSSLLLLLHSHALMVKMRSVKFFFTQSPLPKKFFPLFKMLYILDNLTRTTQNI